MPYGRLATAIVTSGLLVLSAPFVGQIRGALRAAFPGQFVTIVGGLLALGLAVALAAAYTRIRERRLLRYSGIGVALLIATAYSAYRSGPNAEANVVERFHFLQYGLIAFLFYRVWRSLGDAGSLLLPVLAGLIVGCAEELVQWFIPNRVGEINDVFLNLIAIGTGLLFSVCVDPHERFQARIGRESKRRAARAGAVAVIAFAAFFHAVHLGHRLDDPEGWFTSRYPRDRLLDLQAARAEAWARSPPPTRVVRLSREDQYLTEGIQHVRERNRMWAEGNLAAAWAENRILEKYYSPVLDTPTHEGAGHRWPEEQRSDAERRRRTSPALPYVSDAYPYPLFAWNRIAFWTAAVILSAALFSVGRSPAPRPRGGVTPAV